MQVGGEGREEPQRCRPALCSCLVYCCPAFCLHRIRLCPSLTSPHLTSPQAGLSTAVVHGTASAVASKLGSTGGQVTLLKGGGDEDMASDVQRRGLSNSLQY